MSNRTNVSSQSIYEPAVGYSRAVRVGPMICVAGTTGSGVDVAEQTRNALRRIESALAELGAAMSDVIRTRIFVTDITTWHEVGAVHAEFFAEIRPAATMVEVAALIEPHLLVEIEAEAYLGDENSGKQPSGPGG